MSSTLSPSVFDPLAKYADAIKKGISNPEQAVASGSSLIAFLTSFFEQFFRNDLNRPDFAYPSDDTKERAAGLRITADLAPEQVRLISDFERLCEFIPDIYGDAYGGSPTLYSDLHREFLPRLLKHARLWAQVRQPDLTPRIEALMKTYAEAIG